MLNVGEQKKHIQNVNSECKQRGGVRNTCQAQYRNQPVDIILSWELLSYLITRNG